MAKILIVDDEPAIRAVLKLQLEKAGHTVQEAADGMEGLVQIETNPPDLVFLDAMIPKMDGWQVCREIKKISQVPIVMLTSHTSRADEARGRESGADEFLGKPWTPADVLDIAAKLLKTKRPA